MRRESEIDVTLDHCETIWIRIARLAITYLGPESECCKI